MPCGIKEMPVESEKVIRLTLKKLLIILLCLPMVSFGQITTTKVAEKKEEISIEPYDSLQNFLDKDLHRYIGQDFYLKGKAESLREYGYHGFLIDYKYKGYNKEKNTYKCCDSYSSKYNELEGKYFNVINVYKHPRAKENDDLYGNTFYLELKEKESGDKVYFEYKADFEFSFPFIVVGFYEKFGFQQKNVEMSLYVNHNTDINNDNHNSDTNHN